MKKEDILVIVIAIICTGLCGCLLIEPLTATETEKIWDASNELFYRGSQMVSKVSLILNEEIIDFEAEDTSIVIYFDNDIVFRSNTEIENQKYSSSHTLEFNDIDSDKVKQFIGVSFCFSDAFSEEELQLIDDIYESYVNNENYEITWDDEIIAMTIKNLDGRKRLTLQCSCDI